MRVLIGTSGYSYKTWKPSFYPADLPVDGFLNFYSQQLPVVEINNTFYRFPTKKVLASWAAEVGEDFSFVIKAPRRITHILRLNNAADAIVPFAQNTMEALGPRLGALLFQLPPNMKKDLPRLETCLSLIDGTAPAGSRPKVAFEFRNPTWFDEEVHAVMRAHGTALCLAESDDQEASDDLAAPFVSTADWGYLRLRRTDYGDAELAAWATRLRAQPWNQVFVFLKHDDAQAPVLAQKLLALLR